MLQYQIISLTIPSSSDVLRKQVTISPESAKVESLFVHAPGLYNLDGVTLELRIGGVEIFPRDFEVNLILVNYFLSQKDVMYPLGRPANCDTVEITLRNKLGTAQNEIQLYLVCTKR
jgi:hypothetical protein